MARLVKLFSLVLLCMWVGCHGPQRPAAEPQSDVARVESAGADDSERTFFHWQFGTPHPEPDNPHRARIIEPDTAIDHKIVAIPPNPNTDYKMQIFPPGGDRLPSRVSPELLEELKKRHQPQEEQEKE